VKVKEIEKNEGGEEVVNRMEEEGGGENEGKERKRMG